MLGEIVGSWLMTHCTSILRGTVEDRVITDMRPSAAHKVHKGASSPKRLVSGALVIDRPMKTPI